MGNVSVKMPFLRVTKWLGDIPIEGVCTSCPDAQFRPSWNNRRPNKAQNEEKMKQAFGRHCREVHAEEVEPSPCSDRVRATYQS